MLNKNKSLISNISSEIMVIIPVVVRFLLITTLANLGKGCVILRSKPRSFTQLSNKQSIYGHLVAVVADTDVPIKHFIKCSV